MNKNNGFLDTVLIVKRNCLENNGYYVQIFNDLLKKDHIGSFYLVKDILTRPCQYYTMNEWLFFLLLLPEGFLITNNPHLAGEKVEKIATNIYLLLFLL